MSVNAPPSPAADAAPDAEPDAAADAVMGAPAALPHAAAVPLRLDGVGKEYRLYDSPRERLKSLLTGRALHRSHWALRDVSFELRRGQCLGVVGHNGAGKSTLLKLVTGTLRPSAGRLQRQGRITAILELGAGFHPDFTGRQNLYFGASLIGIDAAHMRALEGQVLAFADIGDAIDRPVKTYSSGMVVRLAFALVTAVEPDLLIIDEALAVGDQQFQKKCVERIGQFRANGCTILFCSHSAYHVRHLCDRALLLENGRMRAFGATEDVLAEYEMQLHAARQPEGAGHDAQAGEKPCGAAALAQPGEAAGGAGACEPSEPPQGRAAWLVHVDVAGLPADLPGGVDARGVQRLGDAVDAAELPVLPGPDLRVTVRAQSAEGQAPPSMAVMLEQRRGVGIDSFATHVDGVQPTAVGAGVWQATLAVPALPLHTGDYVISIYLFDASGLAVYEQWDRCVHFRWIKPHRLPGLVHLPHHWGAAQQAAQVGHGSQAGDGA